MSWLRERWFPTAEDDAEAERIVEAEQRDYAVLREFSRSRAGELMRKWIEREIVMSDDTVKTDHGQMLVDSGTRCGLRKVLKHIEGLAIREE